jgi:hypothetical protein
MKRTKELLKERAKAAAEIERINGVEAQAEKDKAKIEEVTLEEVSATAASQYETLKLKIAACRNSRKKLEARIEEIDAELGREYLTEIERAHAQLHADDTAALNKLVDGVLPLCDGKEEIAIDRAKKVLHSFPVYERNRIVTNAFSSQAIMHLRNGMGSLPHPIHQLCELVIAAEAKQRRA